MRTTCVLVVLLSTSLWALAGEKTVLEQALEAFKARKYKSVVTLTAKLDSKSADYLKGRYLAGEAHLKLREPEKAEAAFRLVLTSKPKAVPALTGLGRALLARKLYDEAEKVLRKAVAEDRKNASARRALGELQLAQDQIGKARATLRAAYKLAPENPFCAQALVEVLLRGGDTSGAGKIAKAFIKARPEHPTGHFLHGLVLDRTKKGEHAIEAYERALHHDPRYLDAHKNLAILFHTMNEGYKDRVLVKKALSHYESYFELGGQDKALMETWRKFQRFVDTQLDLDEEDEDEEDDDG